MTRVAQAVSLFGSIKESTLRVPIPTLWLFGNIRSDMEILSDFPPEQGSSAKSFYHTVD